MASSLCQFSQALTKVLMKAIRVRPYVVQRDLEEVLDRWQDHLRLMLGVDKEANIWKHIDKDQDHCLKEEEIIQLILNLFRYINEAKLLASRSAQAENFELLKTEMNRLSKWAVDAQKQLRTQIKVNIIKAEVQRQQQLDRQQLQKTKLKASLHLQSQARRKASLSMALDEALGSTIKQSKKQLIDFSYKLRPSPNLKQAKDETLIMKLSPFAWDPKRAFDFNRKRNSLSNTIDVDNDRYDRLCDHIVNNSKRNLERAQQKRRNSAEMKFALESIKTMQRIQEDDQQKGKAKQAKMHRILSVFDKNTSTTVQSLRLSLSAYEQKQEKMLIGEIVREHKLGTQFNSHIRTLSMNGQTVPSYLAPVTTSLSKMCLNQAKQYQHSDTDCLKTVLRRRSPERDIEDPEAGPIGFRPLPRKYKHRGLVGMYDLELNQQS